VVKFGYPENPKLECVPNAKVLGLMFLKLKKILRRKKMKKFPKLIYVNIEELNSSNEFYVVNETVDDLPSEDQKIAIYELKEIKNLVNKKELK